MVYQVALQDPLVVVPVEVADAGVYAFFLDHGADEVATALVSAAGEVLVAAAEEGGVEEEEEGEEETETETEEGGGESATAAQWANGIAASLLVSACRYAVMRTTRVVSKAEACFFLSGSDGSRVGVRGTRRGT